MTVSLDPTWSSGTQSEHLLEQRALHVLSLYLCSNGDFLLRMTLPTDIHLSLGKLSELSEFQKAEGVNARIKRVMYKEPHKKTVQRLITERQHWHLRRIQQIVFVLPIRRLHGALILHPVSIGRSSRMRLSLEKGLLAMGFRSLKKVTE